MSESTIEFSLDEGVALLRLAHGVTNGVNPQMVQEMQTALDRTLDEARGLVLAGGEKFFSMGLHLPALLELDRPGMLEFYQAFNDLCLRLYTLPLPTASAIRGHAPAGGAILALTTDFRVMALGKPRIGLNEVQIGVAVPFLAHMILRQVVGDRAAVGMAYTGRLFGADQALGMGLVDEAVVPDEVEVRAMEKVRDLAALPINALAANKAVRTAEVSRIYAAEGRAANEQVLDFWFDPDVRALLKEAAKLF